MLLVVLEHSNTRGEHRAGKENCYYLLHFSTFYFWEVYGEMASCVPSQIYLWGK